MWKPSLNSLLQISQRPEKSHSRMQEVKITVNFKQKSKLILSPSDPFILLVMKDISMVHTCNLSELFLFCQTSAPKDTPLLPTPLSKKKNDCVYVQFCIPGARSCKKCQVLSLSIDFLVCGRHLLRVPAPCKCTAALSPSSPRRESSQKHSLQSTWHPCKIRLWHQES